MIDIFPLNSTTLKTGTLWVLFVLMIGTLSAQTPLYTTHWTTASDPDFSSGSAGAVTTSLIEVACSQIKLSVTDTATAPLPAFNAYILNPQDSMGTDITDLSGNLQFFVRVRSLEAVRMALLLRSGGGGSSERSDRIEVNVPGDTTSWYEYTFTFDASNISGFDSTDLRDIWVYLDRGNDNFAGNAFYLDYISIGAKPDSSSNSTCPTVVMPPPVGSSTLYTVHWTSSADPDLSGSTAGSVSTTVIDSVCSQIMLSVTDTANAPLPAFNAYLLNPQDSAGTDLVDLSGNLSLYARVRSLEEVRMAVLLRSGGGSSSERSDLIEVTIPGDTANWSEVSFVFDTSNLGGFDSTDLRDVWVYLDRGNDNFAGNAFYLDYFSIGGQPDSANNSTCPTVVMPPPPVDSGAVYTVHWTSSSDPDLAGTTSGPVSTITIDTVCSEILLTVTDPLMNPLPPFNAYTLSPVNEMGTAITDLSGKLQIYTRVRSADAVRMAVLLRSGGGSSSERTDRIEVTVPGELENWSEYTFTFDATNIAGFDSTDLRDLWIYLDRGDENFAGNAFYLDFLSIGQRPAKVDDSNCLDFPYLVHWADTAEQVFTGSGATALRQTIDTACSQLALSVTDPTGVPFEANKPIIINPVNASGAELTNLTGQTPVTIRIRSKEAVSLGFLMRSGDGTAAFRTDLQEQTIPGDLNTWTEVEFSLDTTNIGGFDSTDLRDIWFYLDRSVDNFAGNEVYIDYVSIGGLPNGAQNSTCTGSVGLKDPLAFANLQLYPNPTQAGNPLRLRYEVPKTAHYQARVWDSQGRIVWKEEVRHLPGVISTTISTVGWAPGFYFFVLEGGERRSTYKLMIH